MTSERAWLPPPPASERARILIAELYIECRRYLREARSPLATREEVATLVADVMDNRRLIAQHRHRRETTAPSGLHVLRDLTEETK